MATAQTAPERIALPVLRGTADGAKCDECPFSTCGVPTKPVFSEFPENPKWILIGEGPGRTEIMLKRPFVGQSGQVVNKLLAKIGRPREQVAILNSTLCMPPYGSAEHLREKAAEACKERLRRELAQWPGKPILTLGAVAARSVIPKAVLDAIDPPDAPKKMKRGQKDRQRIEAKLLARQKKAIEKIEKQLLKKVLLYREKQIRDEIWKAHRRKPSQRYIIAQMAKDRAAIERKVKADAPDVYAEKLKEKELKKKLGGKVKPKKKKPIKITDIMSATFDVDVDGSGPRPLIPAIHPAALLRGGGATIGGTHSPDLAYVNLMYDALKVDRLAKGDDLRLHPNIEIEFTDADRALRLFLEMFEQALKEGELAIDLETYVEDPDRHHALMAYVARIRALGLATEHRAVSVMWDLLPAWTHSLMQLLFGKVRLTFHNGLYDYTVFRAYGFIINDTSFADTLLAHHAAFPGVSHRLQNVATQFFCIQPWKSEFRNAEETPEKLTTYNALDTFATRALRAPLEIMVKKNNVERVYERDRKMAMLASQMHLDGMPVSREVNTELLNSFSKIAAEERRKVDDAAADPKIREAIFHHLAIQQASKQRKDDPDDYEERYNARLREMKTESDWKWNINAGKHIAALLLAMGVSLHQKTETGEVSTKKEILESLAHLPIVRNILKYREQDKALGTFIWPMFDRYTASGDVIQYGFCDENDRCHSIWSTHKISGRWASRDPVVSNPLKELIKTVRLEGETDANLFARGLVSRGFYKVKPEDIQRCIDKGEAYAAIERPTSKRQFVARHGRKFVSFDLAQLEARIIAIISGDPFLLDVFATGKDVHTECAKVIFTNWDQLVKGEQKRARSVTKNVEYGAFYGGSIDTLWKTLLKDGYDLKLADVERAVGLLMRRMAGVVRWQRETVLKASTYPFKLYDFVDGRTRWWPLGNVDANEALNIVPQATGAAIMNTGMERMIEVCACYKQAFPIVQVHDASVFEVWEDDAEKFQADLDRVFPQEYERDGHRIPFPIESRISQTWARAA